jgi:hypothetical protein
LFSSASSQAGNVVGKRWVSGQESPLFWENAMKKDQTTSGQQGMCYYFTDKEILYHPHLDENFDNWASQCGWNPKGLRDATQQAILSRHHEAVIEHESRKARGTQPDIFTLSLGLVDVYYTVEAQTVVVRGYGWEISGEPANDWDGGGLYCEAAWSRS